MKALTGLLLATAISAAPLVASAAPHGGGGHAVGGHGGYSHGYGGHGYGGGYGHGYGGHGYGGGYGHGYGGHGYGYGGYGGYWGGGLGLGLALGFGAGYLGGYYDDFPGYYYYPYAYYPYAEAPTPSDGALPPPYAATGSALAQPQACGQWVWNASLNKYEWAASACPAASS